MLLPDRYENADGGTRPTAAPTAITVHAEDLTPIVGEQYAAVPTIGAVTGRQWVLARVRMPTVDGTSWRLHRRGCWQATGEAQQITTVEAAEAYLARRAAACDVCRPDRALSDT